jgi:hypothetical protein
MKKHLLLILSLIGLAVGAKAQVTITIDAGLLKNTTGTAVEPDGGLLQLLASPTGTFGAPTSSSYYTGDNVLVTSFAVNSVNSGVSGETLNTLSFLALTTSTYTITPGEDLLLRFYPSLTYSSGTNYATSAPPLATTYGQVRSNSVEFPSDASETPWIVPSSGSTVDLTYITANDGGTYANNTAYATNVVLAGAVPEPATYALLACGVAGLLGLRAWKLRGGAASM